MANNYYRRLGKCLLTGITASGGAVLIFQNVFDNEKCKVYAARPSTLPTSNLPHGQSFVHKWDPNWDRRNPGSILEEKGIKSTDKDYQVEYDKLSPKATRHIFLIRHGQYNLEGKEDGERHLTELGRMQAQCTGDRLKELNFPYSTLCKSTMLRAQETGDIILNCLNDDSINVKNCNLLEEGAPIPPDPPVKHWKPEMYFYRDGPRIEGAFRKYIHRAKPTQTKDSYEIIVCHANVIRYFICRALQFPPDAWLRFTLHHCSITWLVITPTGRVIIRGIGDSGHIPPPAVTSN